ncbi:MAG: hypothetical protein ACO3GM_03090 [Candidatus Limnocylindrus sp.]
MIAALTTDGRVQVTGYLTPSADGTPTGSSTTLDPSPDGSAVPGVVVVLHLPDRDVTPADILALVEVLR